MGELTGLKDYLVQNYEKSIFTQAAESGQSYILHRHGPEIVRAKITENLIYDIKAEVEEKETIIPKIEIKFLYPSELSASVKPLLKEDKKVKELGLEPILKPNGRFFIKNKTLFPLMKENEVVFFTLLEGDLIRGVVAGFSRYEITVNLKGRVPITILRHGIYDLRNKKGRCFLKSFQQERRDWEKSELFAAETRDSEEKGRDGRQ